MSPLFHDSFYNWISLLYVFGKTTEFEIDGVDLYLPPSQRFNNIVEAMVELTQITCYGHHAARLFQDYKLTHDEDDINAAAILQRQYFQKRIQQWVQIFEPLHKATKDPVFLQELAYIKLVQRVLYIWLPQKFTLEEAQHDANVEEYIDIFEKMSSLYFSTGKSITQNQRRTGTTYQFPLHLFLHVYMLAIKCRNPLLRNRALSLLKGILYASKWDDMIQNSAGMVHVLERVINVEQEGLEDLKDPTGAVVPSEWARVTDVKYISEHSDGTLFQMQQRINGRWCLRDEKIDMRAGNWLSIVDDNTLPDDGFLPE